MRPVAEIRSHPDAARASEHPREPADLPLRDAPFASASDSHAYAAG
jgi:hypothetical protein